VPAVMTWHALETGDKTRQRDSLTFWLVFGEKSVLSFPSFSLLSIVRRLPPPDESRSVPAAPPGGGCEEDVGR